MPVIRFLILLTLSATTWGDEDMISDCLDVAGKLERLVCYDERAREYRREHGADVTSSPQAPSAQTSSAQAPSTQTSRKAAPIQTESDVPAVATIDLPRKAQPSDENFGKFESRAAPKTLATRIQSIVKAPLGNHVMTLSNGQIWSENEPNRRRITAGQNVTITKKRLYYEMRLESGRRVPVRRIDTN